MVMSLCPYLLCCEMGPLVGCCVVWDFVAVNQAICKSPDSCVGSVGKKNKPIPHIVIFLHEEEPLGGAQHILLAMK